MNQTILLIGASTRAAAFSALRAGMRPYCLDLFADSDLARVCPVRRISAKQYPHGILRLLRELPEGPCIYTGALENHPKVVERIGHARPLWGSSAETLKRCRSPFFLQEILQAEGLPCLRVYKRLADVPAQGRWLIKPLASAGGGRISFVDDRAHLAQSRSVYVQEFAEGEAGAAIFVADGQQAQLLGVTRQLVGCAWLHAAPFHYCGSIGPLNVDERERNSLEQLGAVLTGRCKLRGLFGVDYIQREGLPWLVELNPRYSASVEVLEYANGFSALALHRQAFENPCDGTFPSRRLDAARWSCAATECIGKAILFAPKQLFFPGRLDEDLDPWRLPRYADIPAAGEVIEQGWPVLTCFARGKNERECRTALFANVQALDRNLGFG